MVHTEHKNESASGKNNFSLPQPARITTSLRKPKAIDYEADFHQPNIIIKWNGSIGVEVRISLPGSGSTYASAERILEQKIKHTQNIRRN
jgi:hypothetical protein